MSECTYFLRRKKRLLVAGSSHHYNGYRVDNLNGVGLPQTKIIKELDYYITSVSKCTYFSRQKKTA